MIKSLAVLLLFILFSCTNNTPNSPIEEETSPENNTDTIPTVQKIIKVDSTLTDSRDGNQYKIKRVNDLWWMFENLRFDTGDTLYYREAYVGFASFFHENDSAKYFKLGRIYDLPGAYRACPLGWRLPTKEEWRALNDSLANCTWDRNSSTGNYRDSLPAYLPVAGGRIKPSSFIYDNEISFLFNEKKAHYWCAEDRAIHAYIYRINLEKCEATPVKIGSTMNHLPQGHFYSCRCVQDAK